MLLLFTMALSFLLIGGPVAAQTTAQPGVQGAASGPWSGIVNLIRQGDRHFNAGRYPEALAEYQRALQKAREQGRGPDECEILNNMAALFMALGQTEQFQQAFAQARACKWAGEKARAAALVRPASGNLLVNGGFEEGLAYPWGTGHYESAQGKSRFGVWWNSMNARAFMKIDADQRHSGEKSLRITNYSPAQPHVFTTTSQRITNLKPNTVYRLSFYARAENLKGGAFFTVDAAWVKRVQDLPRGTYDWTSCSASINIGHNDYIDLRFILADTGAVWLDDLVVEMVEEPAGLQALLQKAESLYDRARFQEALALYEELAKSHPDQPGVQMQVRHQAGRIHLALGRYEEALTHFRWLAEKDSRLAPMALGDLYYQLGEFDRAQEQYDKALELYKGDQGTVSRIKEKVAANLLAQGKWDQAFAAQRQSLLIQRHIGDLHGQALALNTTGLLYLMQKEYAQALEPLVTAGKLAQQLNDPRLLATARINQGEALFRQGQVAAALQAVEEGLRLAQAMGDIRSRLQALYVRARCHRQSGAAAKALADFREAMTLLQGLYAHLGVTPRETRQAFLNQFGELYRDYIDLLLELYQKDPRPEYREEAFQRAEEARARLFTEMISEVRATQAFAASGQDPELGRLLIKEREMRLRLEGVRRQFVRFRELPQAQRPPGQEAALEKEMAQALADSQQIQGEIRRKFPRYADLKNPRTLTFQEIQGLLRPDEAVLGYFVTPNRTALWALDKQRVELRVLRLGRQALREAVGSCMDMIQRPLKVFKQEKAQEIQAALGAFDLARAHALYQGLVGPVAGILNGKRLVFLAPDDLLYQLPFEALVTRPVSPGGVKTENGAEALAGAPFWVKEQTLSYVPSVSVLRSLRTLAKTSPAQQSALVAFADPIFEEENGSPAAVTATRQARLEMLRRGGAWRGGTLSRLPETAKEAREAAQAMGGREEDLYLQRRATEHNLKKLPLASYRTLLFATHGLMAGEFRPGLQPALALSFVGDPDNDGLLEMGEILGLDLKARLVVLSACNTGRSSAPADRGEGFAGLTRSFMYAGAESLVVTLWSVESDSAMRLMRDFYGRLKNQERAAALADAKRAMIGSGASLTLGQGVQAPLAHPLFWAPYILVGDGR